MISGRGPSSRAVNGPTAPLPAPVANSMDTSYLSSVMLVDDRLVIPNDMSLPSIRLLHPLGIVLEKGVSEIHSGQKRVDYTPSFMKTSYI